MKTFILTLATPVLLSIGMSTMAATIQIERTFSFVEHTRVLDTNTIPTTFFTDVYMFEALPVVLPSDTYDSIEVTLRPENGQRLVVDTNQLFFQVRFQPTLSWVAPVVGGELTAGGHSVSYTNGSGDLPTATVGDYGLADDRSFIFAFDGFSTVSNGFAFDAVTITDTFEPVTTSGTLDPLEFKLTITSLASGDVPDIGRFTFLVPEPTSLALLGLGGLIVCRRRSSH
ncbi:MAG: PEP-CTERM sorting domain-containing protein [Planctomycetota bacterium]